MTARKSLSVTKRNKHGLANTPEYRHWVNMITRCEYPGATGFALYGGRGIKICERWRSNVQHFYEDMGPRPSPTHSVDRIDVNGDYGPANCRWASPSEQGRNKRINHLVSVGGKEVTLADAAEGAPVNYNTVLYRLKRGWSVENAVTLPPAKGAAAMRREFSNRQKAEIVDRAMNERGLVTCEGCGLVLGKKPYDIDHTIAEALVIDKSKPLTIADGQLLGVACCHRGGRNKTVDDVRAIARAKRRAAKHNGIKKASTWQTKWKRKMDGSVVPR